MRKLFDCGHKGKGRFCNRCKLEEKKRAEELARRKERDKIYTTIGQNVGSMPEAIAVKAFEVWENLLNSKSIHDLEGWRKLSASTLNDFAVFDFGKGWRLIASLENDRCIPIHFFSHQDYNNWLKKNVKM
ncbi:MAG: hypothetical protein Q9M10_08360 [Mariprofundaceae bacterium]|nr:hypothetical protein [Mariprofundaceae bacterium]